MAPASGVISAFTEEQTERLTGVSRKQLRYWDKTGFFTPGITSGPPGTAYGRLYTFRDVVALRVLGTLRREANVSLPHLREVKDALSHLGDDLWAQTTLYVLNRKVIVQNPEIGVREEVVSGQAILGIPIRVVSEGVEEAAKALRRRDPASVGRIERHRNVAGNRAVVAGTRIQVASVKAFADAGYTVEQIRREYPSLTEEDVRSAIAYDAAA